MNLNSCDCIFRYMKPDLGKPIGSIGFTLISSNQMLSIFAEWLKRFLIKQFEPVRDRLAWHTFWNGQQVAQ